METMTNDRSVEIDIILAKIEKMWRRANHPNTPEAEKAVAQAKAISLMEQHRIEMGMLDLDETDELGDHEFGIVKGSYGLVYLSFVSAVAEAFDCKVWWRNSGMTYRVYLTGYQLTQECARRTIAYYSARTTHGSTLSQVVHAWGHRPRQPAGILAAFHRRARSRHGRHPGRHHQRRHPPRRHGRHHRPTPTLLYRAADTPRHARLRPRPSR